MFKKIILKILTFIEKWWRFFKSLYLCKNQKEIVLFHVESWHFRWHLGSIRHYTYREIIGRRRVIFIDLTSISMVKILNLVFGAQKEKRNLVEYGLLQRHIWDMYLKGSIKNKPIKGFLENRYHYHLAYEEISTNLVRRIESNVQELQILLELACIKGVAVIQDAYFDQYVKILCADFNKKIYLPESKYGFYITSSIGISCEKKIYLKLISQISNVDQKQAKGYLENRIAGKYESSPLCSYMKDKEVDASKIFNFEISDDNYILYFLHAFTDSPNVDLSSLDDMQYIDHYDFFLDFYEEFRGRSEIKVLVKPHPSSLRYPGDKMFLEKLQDLCGKVNNFSIISSKLTINELKNRIPNDRLICLSGYGSVSVECAYLGLQVFNYKRNIYTELGISKFIKSPIDLITPILNKDLFSEDFVTQRAIEFEAANIVRNKKYIFTGADTAEKESQLIAMVSVE